MKNPNLFLYNKIVFFANMHISGTTCRLPQCWGLNWSIITPYGVIWSCHRHYNWSTLSKFGRNTLMNNFLQLHRYFSSVTSHCEVAVICIPTWSTLADMTLDVLASAEAMTFRILYYTTGKNCLFSILDKQVFLTYSPWDLAQIKCQRKKVWNYLSLCLTTRLNQKVLVVVWRTWVSLT